MDKWYNDDDLQFLIGAVSFFVIVAVVAIVWISVAYAAQTEQLQILVDNGDATALQQYLADDPVEETLILKDAE